MGLDLDQLDQRQQRWVPLVGSLKGVELLIAQSNPREGERFRQVLIRQGVMRLKDGQVSINGGREDDFFRMFAEKYVLNWRGDIKPEGTEYTIEKMGRFLGVSTEAFDQVTQAISEDADFFASNGTG